MRTRRLRASLALLLVVVAVSLPGCGKGDATSSASPNGGKPKAPASYDGSLDVADPTHITGWAWDKTQPDQPIQVEVYDGDTLLATIPADQFRQDLSDKKFGNGKHRFLFRVPRNLKDGKEHTIHVKYAGTDTDIPKSPKTLTASTTSSTTKKN
jgi:hypothetical protein